MPQRLARRLVPRPVDHRVLSFRAMRTAVGLIGMLLPWVLLAGKHLIDGGPSPLPAISDYYYSSMRNVFIGALCAMAMFLFAYRFASLDNIVANLAAVGAAGAAVFPTNSPGGARNAMAWVHAGCAALLFMAMAVFCVFLFPRRDPEERDDRVRRRRAAVYRVLGALIAVGGLGAGACYLLGAGGSVVFWLETLGVSAFGVAWFVKGWPLPGDRDTDGWIAPDRAVPGP